MPDETLKEDVERYKSQMIKYGYNEVERKQAVDDLNSGLTFKQVEKYLGKGLDLRQMRVMSLCMKKEYPDEVMEIICNSKFDGFQMEVALEFYEKGVPLVQLGSLGTEIKNSVSMRKAYEKVLLEMQKLTDLEEGQPEYVAKLVESIESVVKRIEETDKKYNILVEKVAHFGEEDKNEMEGLLQNLKDKDALIGKLSRQINEVKEESELLKDTIRKVEKEKNAMKGKVAETKQTAVYYGNPVSYETYVGGGAGQVLPIERTVRKSNCGVARFVATLGFKKKSRQDIVKMIASKELLPEQLVQIRVAIQRGLTEGQMVELINNKVSAEQMKEIIEIAVLENTMQD